MSQSLALYRKYRGSKFSDILGQDHITKSLENAIKNGNISHAYLFTGPHGVGKTSVARILAHEVNDLAYEPGGAEHLDIVEIDAASNRRIDEIRELRDKIHIAPSSAKYRVYIIDEVHMLTKEAFNALLKTLEEPPEHAIFILATTEAHKLPPTIISRTQRHSFKPLAHNVLVKQLKNIAVAEKINIDDAAISILATHGEGSFRDAISLLDQIGSHGSKVRAEDVSSILGLMSEEDAHDLFEMTSSGDAKKILNRISELVVSGVSAKHLSKQLIDVLRQLAKDGNLGSESITLVEDLLKVSSSSHPQIQLELALLKTVSTPKNTGTAEVLQVKPASMAETKVSNAPKPVAAEKKEPQEQIKPVVTEEVKETSKKQSFDPKTWKKILDHVKRTNNPLYAVLRMCQANVNEAGNILILKFNFAFHKKQADDKKNRATLVLAISEITDQDYEIETTIDVGIKDVTSSPIGDVVPAADTETMEAEEESDDTMKVLETFGGGEVIDV